MTKFYAKINEQNEVVGIRACSKAVASNDLISIERGNADLLGQVYNPANQQFLPKVNNSEVPAESLIDIQIDNITNTLADFDDSDNEYTVHEKVDCIATGQLAIPDQKFRGPFLRVDTGRTQIMLAEVINGAFTITINFKTSGKWVVNKTLLNSELQQPVFDIQEHTFFVI